MSATSRSVYRDTVLARRDGDGVLVPASGAQVRFYLPDGGALTPLTIPLYRGPDDNTPLVMPYVTDEKGEIEVWADAPTRARQIVFHRGVAASDEIVDLEPPPGSGATDQDIYDAIAAHEANPDAHDQYVTEPEGNLLWLPLSHQPGVDPHPQYLQASVFNQPDPLPQYQQESERAQPGGYAPLDPNGLLPTAHLPPLAITNTFVVANEAEQLALDAQTGDLAIRTDTGKSYILAAEPASEATNWKELSAAAPVQSVDGRVGVVDLSDRYQPLGSYAPAVHDHDDAYVNVTGDDMEGQLAFIDGSQTNGGLALYGDGGGHIGFGAGRVNLDYHHGGGADPRRLLLDSSLQVQTNLYVGASGTGLPVTVSPDAGNILQWLPNGFFAGLGTANVTVVKREEFSPAATATSVTLAAAPTTVLEVSRNGVAQSAALGHYSVAGAVVTFTDAFVAGEQVLVLYEIGTSQPVDSYSKGDADLRFVNITGDTVTGPITMQADLYFDGIRYVLPLATGQGWVGTGSNAFEGMVATKGYFTSELWYQGTKLEDRYVDVGGDTMVGNLIIQPAGQVATKLTPGYIGYRSDGAAYDQFGIASANGGELRFGSGSTGIDLQIGRDVAGIGYIDGSWRVYGGTSRVTGARAHYEAKATGATVSARFGQINTTTARLDLTANAWHDGTAWQRDDTAKASARFAISDGGLFFSNAAAAANPLTWLDRAHISPTGTLTLYPDAGAGIGFTVDQGGVMVSRGGAIHLGNPAQSLSMGWAVNASNQMAHVVNGALSGTHFTTNSELFHSGAISIRPGVENLSGEWLTNTSSVRQSFVGLDGTYRVWRVYNAGAGSAGDKLLVNLDSGLVSVPGSFAANHITTNTSIQGQGGSLTIASTGNTVLSPAGGVVHPDGDGTRYLGHNAWQWAYVFAKNLLAQQGLDIRAGEGGGFELHLDAGTGAHIFVYPRAVAFAPATNGGPSCGTSGNRWSGLWTTAGAINSSSVAVKENLAPLDSEQALAAFRRTTFWRFDYKRVGGDYYGGPGAERGFVGRHGIVLQSPDHPADPFFALPDGESTEPMHYATGIALALRGFMEEVEERQQALAAEVADLKARLARG